MKKTLSLFLACTFCLVGLSVTGCGGGGENQVVESDSADTTDSVLETDAMKDQYAEEMRKAQQGSGGN